MSLNHVPHEENLAVVKHDAPKAGMNVSWSSVLAGLLTFITLQILFSLVGTAIGLGTADLNREGSANAAATGVLVWTVISMLLSFFAAGVVAGASSGRHGMLHGFLSFGLSLVVALVFLTNAVAAGLSTIGSVLGTVTNATVKTVATVGGSAGEAIGNVANGALDQVVGELKVNPKELDDKTRKILVDSGVDQLHPDYLQNQLNEIAEEAKAAAKNVVTNPDSFKSEAEKLAKSVEERLNNVTSSIDKDAVAKAVAKNSDLSETEAKEMTENIVKNYNDGVEQAKQQLEAAKVKLAELEQQATETVAQVKDTANDVMNVASTGSLIGFFGLLVSLAAAVAGGYLGNRAALRKTLIVR